MVLDYCLTSYILATLLGPVPNIGLEQLFTLITALTWPRLYKVLEGVSRDPFSLFQLMQGRQ